MDEKETDKIWKAIQQLQEDVNKLCDNRLLYKPKVPTAQNIQQNVQQAVSDGRQSTSVLAKQSNLRDFWKPKDTWSGVEWEQWANDIHKNYPAIRMYLPEWFLKKIEKP